MNVSVVTTARTDEEGAEAGWQFIGQCRSVRN